MPEKDTYRRFEIHSKYDALPVCKTGVTYVLHNSLSASKSQETYRILLKLDLGIGRAERTIVHAPYS